MASDINTDNYTKLPFEYENKYLYHYIFNIYKKIYLKKLIYEFNMSNQGTIYKFYKIYMDTRNNQQWAWNKYRRKGKRKFIARRDIPKIKK